MYIDVYGLDFLIKMYMDKNIKYIICKLEDAVYSSFICIYLLLYIYIKKSWY